MVNRFKLFLLLLILAVLGILFVQNQQPLSIKLLCPDVSQSCLYQTRRLPLAIWMGLFILAGIITSLIWQLFNRFSYSVATKKGYSRTEYSEDSYENVTTAKRKTNRRSPDAEDWSQNRPNESWDSKPVTSTNAEVRDDSLNESTSISSEYEVQREPESVTRSGSTYSYKFKDKSDEDNSKQDAEASEPANPNQNINLEKDDEEWI